MTAIQAIWIIGLNIASYLLIKMVGVVIRKSPELTETFIKYLDANLYYTIFVSLLNFAILFFILRHRNKEYASANENNSTDMASTIIREIASKEVDPNIIKFTNDGREFHGIDGFEPLKEWARYISAISKLPDIEYFNLGEKYYFLDLINNKRIDIPTGLEARDKKVENIANNGMVLMLRKK